jgi:hypothetical protein
VYLSIVDISITMPVNEPKFKIAVGKREYCTKRYIIHAFRRANGMWKCAYNWTWSDDRVSNHEIPYDDFDQYEYSLITIRDEGYGPVIPIHTICKTTNIWFGNAEDVTIYYDGTDLVVIDP